MHAGSSGEALEERAKQFGDELLETLQGTVESNAETFDYTVVETGSRALGTLRSTPQPYVQLYAQGEGGLIPTFTMGIEYKVFFNHFLTVQQSSIRLGLAGGGREEPIFRYEYLREPNGKTPSAHLHVHGHRDEFIHGMLLGTTGRPGKRHQGIQQKGTKAHLPTMSQVHFPLGGRRLRPGIEDVLELLIEEFGIAPAQEEWRPFLEKRREQWRRLQTRALVSQNVGFVKEILDDLGYEVTPRGEGTDLAGQQDPALREY